MRGLGVVLLILGVGSYAAPLMGVPLQIRFVPPEYRLHASIVSSVVGIVLVLLSLRRKKQEKK